MINEENFEYNFLKGPILDLTGRGLFSFIKLKKIISVNFCRVDVTVTLLLLKVLKHDF